MKMLLAATMVLIAASAALGTAPRFAPHDPVTVVAETGDASAVRPTTVSHDADAWEALRGTGDRTGGPALNVNTIGEVPDSSWFTNRMGHRPMSISEIVRGPDSLRGALHGPWTVIGGKTDGITPGLRVRDGEGRLFFVKFDPRAHPELGSGAEVVATKLFFALGYNVPENYVVAMRRDELTVAPDAKINQSDGVARRMTDGDVDRLLARAARNADRSYRVLASLRLPGQPVGPFRYTGTRADDPNDLIPHEHRRELRALRVFAAWLNHVDTKSQNSLDTLVSESARSTVRHHLLDFGSTLGSAGTGPKDRSDGHEYLFDVRRALLSLVTFGAPTAKWERINYPALPAIGRIEGTRFRVETWKPTFPNPAFDNADADDLFWAARRVMAFTDAAIRAVVSTARFSDPAAEAYLADALIARRNQIGRALLPALNPVVQPAIVDGRLTFHNAATEAGVADEPRAYRVQWFAFDNNTGTTAALTAWASSDHAEAAMPAVPASTDVVAVDIAADHPRYPSWATPVRAYFRRGDGATWTVAGFARLPTER